MAEFSVSPAAPLGADVVTQPDGVVVATNRTENWAGPIWSLTGYAPNVTYHVAANGVKTSAPSADLKITLRTTPAGGDTSYVSLAQAVVNPEGVDIAADFTIPEGTVEAALYIEDANQGTPSGDITVTSFAAHPL